MTTNLHHKSCRRCASLRCLCEPNELLGWCAICWGLLGGLTGGAYWGVGASKVILIPLKVCRKHHSYCDTPSERHLSRCKERSHAATLTWVCKSRLQQTIAFPHLVLIKTTLLMWLDGLFFILFCSCNKLEIIWGAVTVFSCCSWCFSVSRINLQHHLCRRAWIMTWHLTDLSNSERGEWERWDRNVHLNQVHLVCLWVSSDGRLDR